MASGGKHAGCRHRYYGHGSLEGLRRVIRWNPRGQLGGTWEWAGREGRRCLRAREGARLENNYQRVQMGSWEKKPNFGLL